MNSKLVTRSEAATRKLAWRAIGLKCLRNRNLLGFLAAYKVAKNINPR